MKPVQYFSPAYLEQCKKMSTDEIVEFLEAFRLLHEEKKSPGKSKLISIKIPEDLLSAFRGKCEMEGIKYQTRIKQLMLSWVKNE